MGLNFKTFRLVAGEDFWDATPAEFLEKRAARRNRNPAKRVRNPFVFLLEQAAQITEYLATVIPPRRHVSMTKAQRQCPGA